MSFSRFGWEDSDVYVFEHVGGFIQCCGCAISEDEISLESFGMYDADTPREMLSHLDRHEEVGHNVDYARKNILAEYEDLDVTIEPYVRSEEEQKRMDEFWKRVIEKDDTDI